jgi:hypothetical protein
LAPNTRDDPVPQARGNVERATRGKANPQQVNDLLKKKLSAKLKIAAGTDCRQQKSIG